MHGLIPIPIDTDRHGKVSLQSLERAISPRSRVIVVAHLFGASTPLEEVVAFARANNLMIVEDCAQGFRRVGDSGNSMTDIAMYSFGPIKTATALGGAVVRVSSPALRQRMAAILSGDSVQPNTVFFRRLIRFSAPKLISGQCSSLLFRRCLGMLGVDFESCVPVALIL